MQNGWYYNTVTRRKSELYDIKGHAQSAQSFSFLGTYPWSYLSALLLAGLLATCKSLSVLEMVLQACFGSEEFYELLSLLDDFYILGSDHYGTRR